MNQPHFRAQSSLIAVAPFGLTLFASLIVSLGTAMYTPNAEARGRGTNGGGGGGVILCPNQAPELTDFWEFKQTDKTGQVAARLKALRSLNYEQAKQVYSENLALFWDERENQAEVVKLINILMSNAQKALDVPGTMISSDENEYIQTFIRVVVDKKAMDPMDSGVIQTLDKTQCKEERIAVSNHDEKVVVTESGSHVEYTTTVRIRRPDLFVQLPKIEQIALLLGHEFIHSGNHGSIGRLERIGKGPSDSSIVRQLNAWITTAKTQEIENFLWRPEASYRVLYCTASLDRSKRENAGADMIHFNLFIDQKNKQTIFEMDTYKNYGVALPARADLAISEEMFMIPAHYDTNVPSGPSKSFKLKINLDEQQIVTGKLLQAHVGQNIFSPTSHQNPNLRDTSFSLQFIGGPNKSVWTKVLNKHGEVEFIGEVSCNARAENSK